MVWLITGLLLVLFGGLVVLTRWASRRPAADETLISDLLGVPDGHVPLPPPEQPDGHVPLPPPEQPDGQPPPVLAPQSAGEGDWLESQLAGIAEWSDRMQEHIASWAADKDPPAVKAQAGAAAEADAASRWADRESRELPQPRPGPGRCIATTAKGSQCKFPARPGDTTCAIHAQRADP